MKAKAQEQVNLKEKAMDKKRLLQFITERLNEDLVALKEAAKATYEAATHEESRPENEYDTRGLEASYLAGAQAQRVAQIEEALTTYKFIDLKSFAADEAISSTALVEVDFNGRKTFVFILPKSGGLILNFEGRVIQVVTPNSPLGEALIGQRAGDTAVVEAGENVREYEILSVQ